MFARSPGTMALARLDRCRLPISTTVAIISERHHEVAEARARLDRRQHRRPSPYGLLTAA